MGKTLPIVILIGALSGCTDAGSASPTAAIRLLDLDGQPFTLWPADQSPITVVLFTRTDCPIANRCAPEIRRLCVKYQPQGVRFLQVYVDPKQPVDAIRRHMKDYECLGVGVRDPEHTLVAFCDATVTPEAVVFDTNRSMVYRGRVNDAYAELGQPRADATAHDLANAIDAIVHGRPVAVAKTKAVGCLIADLKD